LAGTFVEVHNLRKVFNGTVAVDGVNFTIERGEIFGLLGPNGAGKTTTIRMMSTTLPISAGDVLVGGHSVQNNPAAVRRLIGVCPQELALYPELSALDNLVFFGRMEGLSRAEAVKRAKKALELLGLEDRIRDRVSKFSGGMKRRVNLAISLMGSPELLFLDEPTVGVDPQSRNHIFNTIENLRDKGMTLLYTTHYMEEADRLCDRIAIMDNGKVAALDTPYNLKASIGDPDKTTLEDVFLNLTGRRLRD
jgi:ABC-2 type transport system ATP-binding protein